MAAGDDDDRELWRRVTAGVKPLKARDQTVRPPAAASQKSEKQPEPKKASGVSRAKDSAAPRPGTLHPQPSPEPSALVPGRTDGVDRRTADRLRRGQLPVEARLDLHGHTQETAFRALTGFIENSVAAGRRCVLVITGKGTFSPDRKGVLRAAVPRWLNEAPLRGKVLAIDTARPQDGGGGAYYILLKRQRDR